jgi:plastocyanin
MTSSGIRKVVAAIVAIGLLAGGAGYAFGSAPITADVSSNSFNPMTFTIDQGETAVFQNPASTSHNVTASQNGPDTDALFRSRTIASGQTPVDGTQYLTAGSYHFICTIHGPTMSADLVVTGNGTPAARPDVSVKILSSSLDKVASSGKLKVKVNAKTASDGVTLTARKGNKKLGAKRNLSLAAGASRTLNLPLTASGRKALRDLGSAQLKLTATVPFGHTAEATRHLG